MADRASLGAAGHVQSLKALLERLTAVVAELTPSSSDAEAIAPFDQAA
jgi:hypothetical protein